MNLTANRQSRIQRTRHKLAEKDDNSKVNEKRNPRYLVWADFRSRTASREILREFNYYSNLLCRVVGDFMETLGRALTREIFFVTYLISFVTYLISDDWRLN